ncbi:hypothetical protein STANM309S_00273 [Streptomyces tanashiensis]
MVATTTSGAWPMSSLVAAEFGVVGERDDPQGGAVDDGRAAPAQQRDQLVGAACRGDADGEAGEGAVFLLVHGS